MQHWLVSALVGWGISSAILMRIWLPDPPPDAFSKFITTSLAGIVGGVLGGAVIDKAASEPMPGLAVVGAVAGALIVVAVLRAFSPRSAGSH